MEDEDRRDLAAYLLGEWARDQRGVWSELRALFFPGHAAGTELSKTNYSVAEDDLDAYYERHLGAQVATVDAAMADLREQDRAAWITICKHHRLGHSGEPCDGLAPGQYTTAVLALMPIMVKRGLVPSG